MLYGFSYEINGCRNHRKCSLRNLLKLKHWFLVIDNVLLARLYAETKNPHIKIKIKI